jgi:hypothetical protein
MPDDKGVCDEPVGTLLVGTSQTPRTVYGSIEKERPIALYFRIYGLEKFGKAWGYVQMSVDTVPASLFSGGQKLATGSQVLHNTSDEDWLGYVTVVWIFNVSTPGDTKLIMKVTDLQDADEGSADIELRISKYLYGETKTPFQFASGELKEGYANVAELRGYLAELQAALDSGELSGGDLEAVQAQYLQISTLLQFLNSRRAVVLEGGSLEQTSSISGAIWNAISGFGSWLLNAGKAVVDAVVNFETHPIESLTAIGNWIAEHPFDVIDIAIAVTTVVVLVAAVILSGGLAAGLIAATGPMFLLDIATVANILARTVIAGEPLSGFDVLTAGLVAFGNAGYLARALRPGAETVEAGGKTINLGRTSERIAEIAEDAQKPRLFSKLGGLGDSLKGKMGTIDDFSENAFRSMTKIDDLPTDTERLKEIFTNNIDEYEHFGSIKKNLKAMGIEVKYNPALDPAKTTTRARYNPGTRVIEYGPATKTSDFLHELRHVHQHQMRGFAVDMSEWHRDILRQKFGVTDAKINELVNEAKSTGKLDKFLREIEEYDAWQYTAKNSEIFGEPEAWRRVLDYQTSVEEILKRGVGVL